MHGEKETNQVFNWGVFKSKYSKFLTVNLVSVIILFSFFTLVPSLFNSSKTSSLHLPHFIAVLTLFPYDL